MIFRNFIYKKLLIIIGICVFGLFPGSKVTFAKYYTSLIVPEDYKNYGTPRDLITLTNGDMWYADSGNNRLVKINTSGEILRTVGRSGNGEGEFSCSGPVTSITRDSDGFLYALDSCKVYKFDFNGGFVASWGGQGDTPATGELSGAYAIHYNDYSGEILVSDTNHSRVVRFSKIGSYLGQFGSVCTLNEAGNLDSGCVTPLVDGEFSRPAGLTTDLSGNIYVVDSDNHRVQVFTNTYTFSFKFGSSDSGDYNLIFPKDVEVLSGGDIVVTSQNSQTIKEFTSDGVYIRQWGVSGTNDQDFQRPEFLTKANDDSLWISDSLIKKFVHYSDTGTYIGYLGNSSNSVAGKFTNPYSVDFDNLGNMYVLDSSGRIQKFDSSGNYDSTIITAGTFPSATYHLAISPTTQNIFVSSESTVFEFDLEGNLLGTLGNHGVNGLAAGTGDFNNARGLAFDSSGNIFISDMYNNRLQKFDPSLIGETGGGFLSEISLIGAGQVWRGDWNSEATYSINNAVMFLGETYISIQDGNTNHEPDDAAEWWILWIPSGDGNVALPTNIYIDGGDNIFVSSGIASGGPDNEVLKIQKYNSAGVWQSTYLDKYEIAENLGGYIEISSFFIDLSGNLYLTEPYFNHTYVYDSGGNLTETIGVTGSGEDQFDYPANVGKNSFTGEIVVVDQNNHRLHVLENGVKIKNLTPSTDVLNISNSLSLVKKGVDPEAPTSNNLSAQMLFGDYIVSDFNVDLTSDRNWATVNAVILPDQSKSLLVNLNPVDAPGISETHSLYITKQQGQTSVTICPSATTIADLTSECLEKYVLNVGDSTLSTETVGSQEYWKVTGLTGTGGFSPVVKTYNLNESSSVSVGETLSLEVTAKDDQGLVETGYRGTVHFSTSPSTSSLPANYTFTESDNGVHTFSSISFSQPGTYSLEVADTLDSSRSQTTTILVTASGSTFDNNSASSSNSSNNSSAYCNDNKPTSIPDLFQIDVNSTTAKLFFTPVSNSNKYYISFSTKMNAEEHGEQVILAYEGVQSHKVFFLKPNTTYYFKVRGQNGCMPGGWSNVIKIKTRAKGVSKIISFYKISYKSVVGTVKSLTSKIQKTNRVVNEIKTIITPSPISQQINETKDIITIPTQTPIKPSSNLPKKCFLWWCW